LARLGGRLYRGKGHERQSYAPKSCVPIQPVTEEYCFCVDGDCPFPQTRRGLRLSRQVVKLRVKIKYAKGQSAVQWDITVDIDIIIWGVLEELSGHDPLVQASSVLHDSSLGRSVGVFSRPLLPLFRDSGVLPLYPHLSSTSGSLCMCCTWLATFVKYPQWQVIH
jgi:hypothetical protein